MLPLFWIWFQFRWPKGRFNLRKVFFCLINSVFANFVCAEFLINGGDCSKDVRNGGWSVGRRGNRGETLCKIQQFVNKTYKNYDLLDKTHQIKQVFNNTHIIRGFFRHACVSSTYPCQSLGPLVRSSVGHTFGFPFSQRLWSPYVKSWR